jgi:hypothetical protein
MAAYIVERSLQISDQLSLICTHLTYSVTQVINQNQSAHYKQFLMANIIQYNKRWRFSFFPFFHPFPLGSRASSQSSSRSANFGVSMKPELVCATATS